MSGLTIASKSGGLLQADADLRYLKLDCSNDPLTGNLDINADLDVSGHVAMGADGVVDAKSILYIEETLNPNAFTGTDPEAGLKFLCKMDSSNILAAVSATDLTVRVDGTDNLSGNSAYVLRVTASQNCNEVVQELIGLSLGGASTSGTTGAILSWNGIQIRGAASFAGADPGDSYGINIQNQGSTGTTNAYGLYIGNQLNATNNYAIVCDGDGDAGRIVLGASQDASIYWDGGANELVIDPTLQAGTQTRLVGNVKIDNDLNHDGSNIGFFGTTPIAKQTTTSQTPAAFTANTSGIVDDTATWNGYTIGDVVAILQAYGLLT